MEPANTEQDIEALKRETQEIWETNATWWAERIGEGNQFQLQIVNPPTERLLALQKGEWVLDIACGGGPFSRRMARAGAHVVAFDFSEQFVTWARQHSVTATPPIEYHVLDATREAALLTLGERRFDAAVCNMALMDMVGHNTAPLSTFSTPEGRWTLCVFYSASLLLVQCRAPHRRGGGPRRSARRHLCREGD